ncbi:MAG TPA: sulfite exporter TauE/SafE family protein [Coleofasciculaceae cyanobacterium]|jgi:hypothetical protein
MTGIELPLAVFMIAALYGAVGHGGASGYLAILALLGVNHQTASTTALVLNLFVAGVSFIAYQRAGHFRPALLAPLLITSVPFAFLGGLLKVSMPVYNILLALALAAFALRMLAPRLQTLNEQPTETPALKATLPMGAVLGLISGIVGVGGGIFLSPLMIIRRWATPKVTSATAAGFILANSLAGLGGRLMQDAPILDGFPALIVAGVLGGWLGSYLGARLAPSPVLCRLLALVLMIAACKLMLRLS